jgi:hypothetical protein
MENLKAIVEAAHEGYQAKGQLTESPQSEN